MKKTQGAVRPRSDKKRALKYKLLDWATAIAICAGILAFFVFGIFAPLRVENGQMKDVSTGDFIFASRLGKYLYGFERGDMLMLKPVKFSPNKNNGRQAEPLRLARAVAFAGEKVTISEGRVYINGELLDESSYARAIYTSIRLEFEVPKGCVFVLPDERLYLTSEMIQELVLNMNGIKGEVRFIVYPFSRMALFK